MIDQSQWLRNNEKHLAEKVKWVRYRLERLVLLAQKPAVTKTQDVSTDGWFKRKKVDESKLLPATIVTPIDEKIEQAQHEALELENIVSPPSLVILARQLGLSSFDTDVLSLCLAMELDTRVASLCAKAQDDANKTFPTFALAFALFDNPDWNSLSPNSSLRYWRLLEINQAGNQTLTNAALAVDERIVNYIKGLNYLDDRLTPLLDPMGIQSVTETLPESQQILVDNIIQRLTLSRNREKSPVIELLGNDSSSKHLVAGQVVSKLGLALQVIGSKAIPQQMGDFETFTRLWHRESFLMPLALYVDANDSSDIEKYQLKRLLARCSGVVFLDVNNAKDMAIHNRYSIEVCKPTPAEQEKLWASALDGHSIAQSQHLAEQFSFNQNEINRLAYSVLHESFNEETGEFAQKSIGSLSDDIWEACRLSARTGMEKLAKRIQVQAKWDQLVLPPEQKTLLQQISDQVAQRKRVYEDWGFRERMNRGLAINALFTGASGTGKTMAAEVIANELQLDLYRIDLSSVVSKYIGETEKNLSKLFDGAEDSGAILFFDEADALFGKRSEVKDSHDRYANIEINYLLQRLETYRGLAILATNMKSALDKAFVRRLRFIVDFPFPDVEQRKEIWEKVFPPEAPLAANFDYKRLAKLNLTGGNIHNVAMNAAFLAAQQNSEITMPLILNAARTEYRKLERPAKESNFLWLEASEA